MLLSRRLLVLSGLRSVRGRSTEGVTLAVAVDPPKVHTSVTNASTGPPFGPDTPKVKTKAASHAKAIPTHPDTEGAGHP